MEEDWDAVLRESIPAVALAGSADDYKRAMMTLIGKVHDTHANLWNALAVQPPVGNCRVPGMIRFVEGRAVVTEQFDTQTDLQVGDVIDAMDGVPVDKLITTWKPLYAVSNEAAMLRDMGRNLLKGPCGVVTLKIHRGSQALALETKRTIVVLPKVARHDLPGPSYRLLSPEVGYVKISDLKSVEAVPMVQAFAKTTGMVIDLRNYPGDFPIFALGSLLMEKPTPFVRFSRLDLKNPGAFYFDSPTVMPAKEPHYAGKIVVLVDEVTQSSAEYHAMAFRAAPNVIVMGSMTAGADGNVSALPLPGGLRTMFSGIGVFYPDHRPTQRVGIVPDRIVQPTIGGVREGRDEVLEAALRHILGAAADETAVRAMAKHQPQP